jgi:hypothetical protein
MHGGFVRASSEDLGLPARQLFLQAVADVAPAVLVTLRASVLSLCSQALAEDRSEYLRGRERGVLEMWESPVWQEFEREVQSWAARWHLTDAWVLEAARDTAHSWDYEMQTNSEPRPGWLYGRYSYAWHEGWRMAIEVRGWEPGEEPRRQAEKRIHAEISRQVKAYFERIEAIAVRQGFRPLAPSRNREGAAKEQQVHRHFRWLAEWQVLGTTHARIAEAYSVSPRSVADAIRKRASEIDLTLRARR